jgi:hypothetical protein
MAIFSLSCGGDYRSFSSPMEIIEHRRALKAGKVIPLRDMSSIKYLSNEVAEAKPALALRTSGGQLLRVRRWPSSTRRGCFLLPLLSSGCPLEATVFFRDLEGVVWALFELGAAEGTAFTVAGSGGGDDGNLWSCRVA